MIPFPNFVAGILIGVFNHPWVNILLSSIIWGIIFCFYVSITQRGRLRQYVEHYSKYRPRANFGVSHATSFYVIEYFTGVSTALIISSITYIIKVFAF